MTGRADSSRLSVRKARSLPRAVSSGGVVTNSASPEQKSVTVLTIVRTSPMNDAAVRLHANLLSSADLFEIPRKSLTVTETSINVMKIVEWVRSSFWPNENGKK